MPEERRVLWADDEIDLLKPHIMFLEGRGYSVTPVSNGDDAISSVQKSAYDVVLLDENMPGRGGLDTLNAIQEISPGLPVVMITKSEEEHIMNEAIGQQIADYLIKPVNPSQILLALKRIFESAGIRKSTLTRDYVREMAQASQKMMMGADAESWLEIAEWLAMWDLHMESISDAGLRQSHADLRREANTQFARFIESAYSDWVHDGDRPMLSTDLMERVVFPRLRAGERVAFVLIDCMRLDLWLAVRPMLDPHFNISQSLYYSILPTATPYSRNAIFSGLFPEDIQKKLPKYWLEDPSVEGSRNKFERELLEANLERSKISVGSWKYQKVFNQEESAALKRQAATFASLDFTALVFNFLDILAHGRAESDILQELSPDETGFRRLLSTWFSRSVLLEMLQTMAAQGTTVVITTDHGAIMVNKAALVHANREASSNLRYKFGSNLKVDPKTAIHVRKPSAFRLPATSPTKHYLLAKEGCFFVYPNNFHHYERQFRNTLQHGGVSLEEMVLPCVVMTPKAQS